MTDQSSQQNAAARTFTFRYDRDATFPELSIHTAGLRTTASVLAASSPLLISIIQYTPQSIGGGK